MRIEGNWVTIWKNKIIIDNDDDPARSAEKFRFHNNMKNSFFSLFVVTFILSLDNCDIFKRYAYLGLLSSHHPRSYLILLTNIVMIVRSNDAKQKILSSDKLSIFNFLNFFSFHWARLGTHRILIFFSYSHFLATAYYGKMNNNF